MDEASLVRARLIIDGVVQGVGYRYSAVRAAERLALVGWVANAADGSVHAVVEGPAPAVTRFEQWAARGPVGARVVGVKSVREPASGEFRRFSVR